MYPGPQVKWVGAAWLFLYHCRISWGVPVVSPASPHPASPGYFLGGDKAQDVVFTLLSEYACLLLLPPNREKEVCVCDGGALCLYTFWLGITHIPYPFFLGWRSPHRGWLRRNDCPLSLRSPICKMRMCPNEIIKWQMRKCLLNCRVWCTEKQVLLLSSQRGVVLEKAGDLSLRFLTCKTGVLVLLK